MMKGIGLIACGIALIVIGVSITVWKVKHGSPQEVWLYCDMLGWCKP